MPPYQALEAYTDFSFLETGEWEGKGKGTGKGKGKGKEEAEHGDGGDAGFTLDDFAPLRMVGNGDMGTVYLVTRVDTKEPFAMKVMRKEVLKARDTAFRADMERDILASLDHPFLPTLYADFETERHRFLVMDYACGGDLNGLRHRQGDKLFSPAAARFYACEVVLAMEYLHSKGVIYRDLKPENILIKEDGHIMLADFDLSAREVGDKYVTRAVVVDEEPRRPRRKGRGLRAIFACAAPTPRRPRSRSGGKNATNGNGIARVTPLEVLTERQKAQKEQGRTHSFVGTEEYVAPEIVWGTGHGKAVDWWTLGILIYEMVCGKSPFKGENRKSTFVNIICKDVAMPGPPGPLKDLVERLLIKDPTRRLGSDRGADDIKSHPFFSGVDWEGLELLARPPYVPAPFVLEEEDAQRKKRAGVQVENAVESRDDECASGSEAVASPSRVLEDMHLAVLEHGGSVRVPDGVQLEMDSTSSSSQGSRFFELSGRDLGLGGEEEDEEEEEVSNVFDDTF